jgi:hypothetical protein
LASDIFRSRQIFLLATLGVGLITGVALWMYQQRSESHASADEAARAILNRMNPLSIQENREYGGYVYRRHDGRYGVTTPIAGDFGYTPFPDPAAVLPERGTLVATWHTHGAAVEGIVSEFFSSQDMRLNQHHGVDGYLATPSGRFKMYHHASGRVQQIGRVATNH